MCFEGWEETENLEVVSLSGGLNSDLQDMKQECQSLDYNMQL
jgi:hypothetical protein